MEKLINYISRASFWKKNFCRRGNLYQKTTESQKYKWRGKIAGLSHTNCYYKM